MYSDKYYKPIKISSHLKADIHIPISFGRRKAFSYIQSINQVADKTMLARSHYTDALIDPRKSGDHQLIKSKGW